jgi:cystathionine beta-lyase
MSDKPRGKATQVGHLGRAPRKFLGAVNTPVFRATTMLFPTVAELEASTRGEYGDRLRPARAADRHRSAAAIARSKAGMRRWPCRRV